MVKKLKIVKFVVRLKKEEREQLQEMVDNGKRAGSVLKHAWILLKADADGPNWSDPEIAQAYNVGTSTAHRVRQAFVEEGMAEALFRKKPTNRQYRKLDGVQEAKLIAVACGQPPEGRSRWTLQLLADRLVALEIIESISAETVRRTLKKTSCSHT